ncbi:MAG: hypothetical protein A3A94_00825 [Candidatus Portnoybacteria bacterium RIFCSPLOWO2_01_FULL_43_11]|uniref:Putative 3-methyladenine DNA glycosylase n=1 Tax=Candidatus Portnoybacteria bacterium RIFCSPLOWO2_01_FULL_43_11 TaxID=1802000 RepID=A0A1G2FJK4_9BACT|nr:MAG: hypothetical protein A3A94_00825 [Candidatus Portnoybacteria bacterium RIFCSPLOWO2_01_FULL_43_11]
MPKRLLRKFYCQPTLKVAQELLGKYLVRQIGQKKLVGKIVETEAYIGPQDKASHAYQGKATARNRAEYLIGGHIYIYLVYGMYWQMNISTSMAGKPECVLIRALEPIGVRPLGRDKSLLKGRTPDRILKLANGPGKLCRWLKLDKSFYAEDLTKSKKIWLENGEKILPRQITATKRIGIDYAGPYWSNKKWRFYIKGNKFVSVK